MGIGDWGLGIGDWAMGVLASGVWSRALGMPLERPKSLTSSAMRSLIEKETTGSTKE